MTYENAQKVKDSTETANSKGRLPSEVIAEFIREWWQSEGYKLGNKPEFVKLAEKVLGKNFDE